MPKQTAKFVLKPIKQSNIITQELENVEKPKIFDIESVTIEQPKTAAASQKLLLKNETNKMLCRVKSR